MKFTRQELLNAGSHKWRESEVDAVTLRNLDDLIRKVNALGYVPPMSASSCLRCLFVVDYGWKTRGTRLRGVTCRRTRPNL